MSPAPTIQTSRLSLRPPQPSDAGPMTLYCSDARVARMTTSIPHPYPPGAAEAWLSNSEARRGRAWAIDATPSGGSELIGIIGFRPPGRGMAHSIGYWIGPPFWNTGYASEALDALVAHLMRHEDIEAIEAGVFDDNPASAAVLAKIGFRETGRVAHYSVARGESVPGRAFRLTRAVFHQATGAHGLAEPPTSAG